MIQQTLKRLQTFISRCLRRFMNLKCFDKLSKKTLGDDQTVSSGNRNQKERIDVDWSYVT